MSDADEESPEAARSKDEFFQRLAAVGQEMIKAHGSDFAIGAFILAARYIAEDKGRAQKQAEAAAKEPGTGAE